MEDREEFLASDAAEAVSARAHGPAAEVDRDVVPMVERARDKCATLGVSRAKVVDRLVGEDDAPAKRVVGAVAFVDGDARSGVSALEEQRRVQTARTTTDDDDAQDRPPDRDRGMVRNIPSNIK